MDFGKQQAEIMEGLRSNTSLQSITVTSHSVAGGDPYLDVRSLASFLASNTSITRADLRMILFTQIHRLPHYYYL